MTSTERYPAWYRLLMDAMQSIQDGEYELALVKTKESLEAVEQIREPNEKLQGLLSIVDFVKGLCGDSVPESASNETFSAVAVCIARMLTANDLRRSLKSFSNIYNLSQTLGLVAHKCVRCGAFDIAEKLYDINLEVNPDSYFFEVTNFAEALRQAGKLDAARKYLLFVLKKIERNNPTEGEAATEALINLAIYYVLVNDFNKADQHYREVCALGHRYAWVFEPGSRRYARCLQEAGKTAEAERVLARLPAKPNYTARFLSDRLFWMDDPRC